MNSHPFVLMCSCPDAATADRIARLVIDERLAACATALPVRSVYRWEGAVRSEPETLLLIKTTAAQYPRLELRLAALHPYEIPEIIALPIVAGAASYLAWLEEECRGDHGV